MRNFLAPVTLAPQLGTNSTGPKSGAQSGSFNCIRKSNVNSQSLKKLKKKGKAMNPLLLCDDIRTIFFST